MKKSPTWLLDFKSDVYSQTGEDGIIEKILEILPARDKWCVEFGAWDGKYLSNTRNLIDHKQYSAVLIEGSTAKFPELKSNFASNPNVYPINQFVGFDSKSNLDTILKDIPIPKDFDLLSIDIDGNDYHVWKAMSVYQPKLVVIEFNPTMSNELAFVQKADGNVNQGCSLAALVPLAKEKGYELVSVLPWNAFFIRKELFPLFEISDNRPETLRTDNSLVTHMFVGFDGYVSLQGSKRMPWHDMTMDEKNFQPVPGFLRKHPPLYNKFQKLMFLSFYHPRKLVKEVKRMVGIK
ncbi:MAG TPA: FkbM family methyltransferase [Cyclobacteriaceae bacterium]|nr:FkbM family methyltransferase [Cyclobacteriaceae bacterium]